MIRAASETNADVRQVRATQRIVVVDADVAHAWSVARLLGGYATIDVAHCLDDAIERMSTVQYDVAMIDESSALHLVDFILDRTPTTRRILMASGALPSRHQCHGILRKPFSIRELLHAVLLTKKTDGKYF